MPKSKRDKRVDLTKTKKHGFEGKKMLFEEVQSLVNTYAHLFIFSVNDMRNNLIKSVRENWRHSRFLFGKNKVMARAFGNTAEDEYRMNLHKIGERLKGQRGLFFTNQPIDEVIKYFKTFSRGDFARSGNRATETVHLKEGPLSQFPHNLEPYLRQLGLPTSLKKGVVHLIQDHTVCNEGDILTPETAKIVKLLGYEMAEFFIKMECVWSQDGTFTNLITGEDSTETNEVNSMEVDNEMDSDNEPADSLSKSVRTEEAETTDMMDSVNNISEKVEIPHLVNGKSKVALDEETIEITEAEDDTDKVTNGVASENIDDKEAPELMKNTIEDDEVSEGESIDNKEAPKLVKNTNENDEVSEDDDNENEVSGDDDNENDVSEEDADDNEDEDSEEEIPELVEDGVSEVEESKETVSNETDSLKSASLKRVSLEKSVLQSPVMLEKRPKFSPKMTRSAMKAKKVAVKDDAVPAPKNINGQKSKKEIASGEVIGEKPARGRAHKRHSSNKSPAERKLRNRSVKIVKK